MCATGVQPCFQTVPATCSYTQWDRNTRRTVRSRKTWSVISCEVDVLQGWVDVKGCAGMSRCAGM